MNGGYGASYEYLTFLQLHIHHMMSLPMLSRLLHSNYFFQMSVLSRNSWLYFEDDLVYTLQVRKRATENWSAFGRVTGI